LIACDHYPEPIARAISKDCSRQLFFSLRLAEVNCPLPEMVQELNIVTGFAAMIANCNDQLAEL
jgi:hypothetical protein